jgi:hypothetical protein
MKININPIFFKKLKHIKLKQRQLMKLLALEQNT